MRWILTGILLATTLPACANVLRFEKDSLVAHGELLGESQEPWKQRAKEDEAYTGNGFHLRFKNGQLLYVGICSH